MADKRYWDCNTGSRPLDFRLRPDGCLVVKTWEFDSWVGAYSRTEMELNEEDALDLAEWILRGRDERTKRKMEMI